MYKRIAIVIAFIFAIFLLTGCAGMFPQNITCTIDEFTQFETCATPDFSVYTNLFFGSAFFGIYKNTVSENFSGYSLRVSYHHSDWLFIQSGNSLVIIADGERIVLHSDKGSLEHRSVYTSGIIESARFDIEPEQIEKIGNATEVKMRLNGSKTFIQGQLSTTAISWFHKFHQQIVLGIAPEEV